MAKCEVTEMKTVQVGTWKSARKTKRGTKAKTMERGPQPWFVVKTLIWVR